MGLAAFAALLRLIDGVVIIMVPLGPEFPPYPLTVHGKVDELTCGAGRRARVNFQRPQSTSRSAFCRVGKNVVGQTLTVFFHRWIIKYLIFHAHKKNGEWEKLHSQSAEI